MPRGGCIIIPDLLREIEHTVSILAREAQKSNTIDIFLTALRGEILTKIIRTRDQCGELQASRGGQLTLSSAEPDKNFSTFVVKGANCNITKINKCDYVI